MRHFPAALLALLLLPPAANAADVPTGNVPAEPSATADEDPLVLSPFEVRVQEDNENWAYAYYGAEQEEIPQARVSVIQQHLREADAIEIRAQPLQGNYTEGKLLWSLRDTDKVAELTKLIRIEGTHIWRGCGPYDCYLGNLFFYKGDKLLEVFFLSGPFLMHLRGMGEAGYLEPSYSSAREVADWFRRNGHPDFYRGVRMREYSELAWNAEVAAFKSNFSGWELARLFPDVGLCKDRVELERVYADNAKSLLSGSNDRIDLLSRIFLALGEGDAYKYVDTDPRKRVAEVVAEKASDADFIEVLERLTFSETGLLGASEAFFNRKMRDRLPEPDRSKWTFAIVCQRLKHLSFYEQPDMLAILGEMDTPDATSAIVNVAVGDWGRDAVDFENDTHVHPLPRRACELLLKRASATRAAEAERRLASTNPDDRAGISRIAVFLALDPKVVNNGIFTYLVYDGERRFLLTDFLTSCRDVEVFQRLVDLMEEDENFLWTDTFVAALETATGHTFFTPNAEQHYLDSWVRESANRQTVREWWAANRDRLASEWAAAPAK